MKIATLGLLIQKNSILLGLKKTGEIGEKTYNGPGGKLEPDETILECLAREIEEEVDVRINPDQAEHVANVTFCVKDIPDFLVHVFIVREWTGEAMETESMIPFWFPLTDLPFDQMLGADRAFMPRLLAGERFDAHIDYKRRAEGFLGLTTLPFTPLP